MAQREKRRRKYVPVIARFNEKGEIKPLLVEYDRAHKYPVDRVLDKCNAACERAGGVGVRYTCEFKRNVTYLWLEKGRWFVEEKYIETDPDTDGCHSEF